jgi:hypothetical protein
MRRVLFLVLPLLVLAARPAPGTCGPLLNEVMADPARDWDGDGAYSYRNDEWVEIVNPGPGSLALDGYFLADEAGGLVYGFTGTLAPGAVRIVYGGQATAWESANGETATGLRLGNDGDTVQLLQRVGASTVAVDSYTYNTYEAEDDRSSGRRPDGSGAWVLFDALNLYTGTTAPLGTGLSPTPGARNDGGEVDPPPTPVEEKTWGQVKTIYSSSR